MKRLFTILIGLLLFCSIAAEIEFFKSKENLDVIIEYERQNDKELNTTFAYPAKQIEIEIIDYDSERELEKSVLLTDIEKNTSSFVFRELFAHSIQVDLTKYELNHLKIQISATERTDVPKTVSPVFIKLYESTVDNFETSYLRNLEIDYPKMLIITYDFLTEYLQDFVMWKMAKGIEVQIATIDDIGGSNNDIKSYIETQYQEWKPDYIILTGDVDDAYQIPSYYITFNGETDVTDLPYCMLDGDDYWPELLLGRISIDSPMELMTIVNKILFYEKTPNLESNWLDSALLIAGNYSNSPPTPTTPVRVTKWLRDKMLAYGYEDIDEYYYPGIYPGTNEIISSIDEGVGFVTYRGWGDANGWHYPHFKRDNVEQLNNGELLPVVTSMVCNTGDFANNVDPCFGELWLRAGWPTLPKGAVAFVGPSDLHTSTKYNNAIFSGFYQGLLTEGIHGFGSAVQRGKIELFNNYPNNQGLDDYVDFYFHVYNMLADPSLAMWTKTPEEIEISLPDEVSLGTNFLEVSLPNMDGAMVTAIKDGELLSKKRIEDGNAILLFNFDSTGEVLITITKPDYLPFTKNITVTSENEDLGIEDFEIIGDLVPGVQAQLQIEIKNYGSQSSNSIDVFLTTTDPKVEILDDTADVPVLNSGESEIVSFIFETNPDIEDDQIINFSIEDNEKILGKLEIQSKNVNFYVTEHSIIDENGFLEPGEMAQIVLELKNIGSLDANNIEAELVSECTALQVVEANYSIGDVSVGQIAEAEFSISAASDTYVGRSARLKIILESASQQVDLTYHDIVIGEITNTAPTGPDNFGYYAYDNYDVSYESVPEYNWIEIDPQEGGNGTVLEMGDDVSEAIAMPFEFTYYDEVCDSITICSNS